MEQWRSGDCLPELILHACEVKRDGDIFEYDLQLLAERGEVLERWEGLRLQKIEALSNETPWPDGLLAPYIERRLEELMPHARVSVRVARNTSSDQTIKELLGDDVMVRRREDGKPETDSASVSVAHADGVTLAVSNAQAVGCDIEVISPRSPETWRGLLGTERFRLAELLAQREDFDTAATRVWTAIECLKKSGAMSDAPLTLSASEKDGWVVMQSGRRSLATHMTSIQGLESKLMLGVLAGP
jgi:enediyne polyketide synthase